MKVPNGWKPINLSSICERITEKNNGKSSNVVTISAQHGIIKQEHFFKKTIASTILDKYFILRKGEFAYNKSYSNGYPMGVIKKLNIFDNAVVTTLYICFRVIDNSKTSRSYLEHYFESGLLNKELTKIAAEGGRAHGLLNVKPLDFMNLKFSIPLFKEQRKIAKILGCWDRAIAACEQLIATSKQQKQALMQQLLTAKKRFGEFTGEWEEVRLGDLGTTYNGLVGKTKIDFGTGEKYIPYINIFKNSSVDINSLDLVNIKSNEKQNVVKYGDIFFTTSSETPEEVGMSSVMLSKPNSNIYLNSFCFGFRFSSFKKIYPKFMQYLLRSETNRRSISILAQGATRYNLSKVQLMNITLFLPTLAEQQKIAQVLTAADSEIEILQQKLAKLQQEKQALMQQLLTGKRRVKVDENDLVTS